MEQNKLTPEDSLKIISDSLNKTRSDIVRRYSAYLLLWGSIILAVSLVTYFLLDATSDPKWNLLMLAIPLVGFPIHVLISRRCEMVPDNEISFALSRVWSAFGVFSVIISVLAVTCCPISITLVIVALFGFAECISGLLLKNWTITVAGLLFGIAGTCISQMLASGDPQSLLFTFYWLPFAGALLALTGILVKYTK